MHCLNGLDLNFAGFLSSSVVRQKTWTLKGYKQKKDKNQRGIALHLLGGLLFFLRFVIADLSVPEISYIGHIIFNCSETCSFQHQPE